MLRNSTLTRGQRVMTIQRLRDSALDLLQFAFVTVATSAAMIGGAFLLLFCDMR